MVSVGDRFLPIYFFSKIQYGQNRFLTAEPPIIGKLSQKNNLIKIE